MQCEPGRSAPCLRQRWRWEHSEIRGENRLKQKRSLQLRLERDTLMFKCHLWKRPASKPVREQQPRYSAVIRVPGNFAEPASKMKTQPVAGAWNHKNLRLCVDRLLGIHSSRNTNTATVACRTPLLTGVLNVVTASSPAAPVQRVSSANCMQEGRRALQVFWPALGNSAATCQGRERKKKIPAGDERGERIECGYRDDSAAASAGASTFFHLTDCFQCRDQIVPLTLNTECSDCGVDVCVEVHCDVLGCHMIPQANIPGRLPGLKFLAKLCCS